MKIKPNKKTFREIKDKEEKVQDFFKKNYFNKIPKRDTCYRSFNRKSVQRNCSYLSCKKCH